MAEPAVMSNILVSLGPATFANSPPKGNSRREVSAGVVEFVKNCGNFHLLNALGVAPTLLPIYQGANSIPDTSSETVEYGPYWDLGATS